MYCREYRLTQPDCHSRGRARYLRVNEESVGNSLSYRTQTSGNSDVIKTISCGYGSRSSRISQNIFALTGDVVGIQSEVMRQVIAKLQLGHNVDGMPWSMVLPEHTISRCDKATSPETLQEIKDAVGQAVRFARRSMRSSHIPGSTPRSCSKWGHQLENNEPIIASAAKLT